MADLTELVRQEDVTKTPSTVKKDIYNNLIFFSQNTVVMTTVVVGNPIRNLRLIIDQIFQGLHNLFFDKEVEKIEPGITEVTTEAKEPHGYLQKGNKKQMCDAEPYEIEHAYGLVYDYEEEKVAPSFNGPQFQLYLERATELCDDDPECKYFNLWTDGGITKYKEGQCENLKDTINSTLTYEKIPLPPKLGTECEDKGYKKYDWYDFKKGKVALTEGSGQAISVWDEYGKCVRVSCKDENKELNGLRKCVPSTIEQLSPEEQMARLRAVREIQNAVDQVQDMHNNEKDLYDECMGVRQEAMQQQREMDWRGYTIEGSWEGAVTCRDAAKEVNAIQNPGYSRNDGSGFADDWIHGGDAAAGHW